MSRALDSPIADGPVVQQVVLVDRIERPSRGRFEAVSLPGHLVQVTTSGRVEQESGGRVYELGPGVAVWHYDDEPVRSHIVESPWSFYTVSFTAPTLGPPPFDRRVKRVGPAAVNRFDQLLEAWRDNSAAPAARHMRVHARLLDLLLELLPFGGGEFHMDPATQLWWELESQIRGDLGRPIDLGIIQKLTGRSLRTIIRSCHHAVGMPPMHRVKQVRLSMARGLVLHSELTFSEISRRVGYGRVQEFSRDYHRHFNATPTEDRAAGPDYHQERPRPQSS